MGPAPVKIQFGAGSNLLAGWQNYDQNVDIRSKLPFLDRSVNFIFAEHVVEHVTSHEAFKFFEECHRILLPGGVVRICVPGIDKIFFGRNSKYDVLMEQMGFGGASHRNSCRAVILGHGHQAMWSAELLYIALSTAGFSDVYGCQPRISRYQELCDVDSHWKVVGEEINDFETVIFEAVK